MEGGLRLTGWSAVGDSCASCRNVMDKIVGEEGPGCWAEGEVGVVAVKATEVPEQTRCVGSHL